MSGRPEQKLALAVVAKAFEDARLPVTAEAVAQARLAAEAEIKKAKANGNITTKKRAAIRQKYWGIKADFDTKQEALDFLFARTPSWRASRDLWFVAAGLTKRSPDEIVRALLANVRCVECGEEPVRVNDRGECDECVARRGRGAA